MGYVPLFDTLTTGTLHGRWPDIGLWPILLSMADRFGNIDVTPQFISGVTGLPVDEVIACIERFCGPDIDSRSDAGDGRRLEPLEPGRRWGWHVVNHAKYREKARLLARDSQRTASGMDAERKRREREAKAECPPKSPEVSPSDGDGDGDGNKKKNSAPTERCPAERDGSAIAAVFEHWKLVHEHPKAKIDIKRHRVIRAALANYTADQLCEAISGYRNSPHHMGLNDRNTRYDDIGLFLRDSAHIDAGLRFAKDPPLKFSALTQRNIAAVEDWVPPEMRRAAN